MWCPPVQLYSGLLYGSSCSVGNMLLEVKGYSDGVSACDPGAFQSLVASEHDKRKSFHGSPSLEQVAV